MIWTILGIEETKDKKAITAAYRAKLGSVNPEEKPEEFKQLRSAYEEALRLADETEKTQTEKTPVELWVEDLDALYGNPKQRADVGCWKELLRQEICQGLDTRPQAEEALIRFLMVKYNLDQAVWLYLNEEFSFTDRIAEFYEKYPRDFVDYVILEGIRYPESLPVGLFVPGENGEACDAYLNLYRKTSRAGGDPELFRQMDALPEHHPYGDALRERCATGEAPEALGRLRTLCAGFPRDVRMQMELAMAELRCGNPAEAETACRAVLDVNPDHTSALRLLADSLAGQERYSEAVEQINELMKRSGGDQKRLYELDRIRSGWNEKLVAQYTEKLLADPDDAQTRFELTWCYLQNNENEKACETAATLPEGQPDAFGYYNLVSQLASVDGKPEEALRLTERLEEVVRAMQPDGTKKTDDRIKRLPEIVARRANCLLQLERKEDAIPVFEEALSMAPDDPEMLTNYIRLQNYFKNYERAAELADRLTVILPASYHGHMLKAIANFEMHRDREAFDAINRAIDLDPSDLQEYLIKLRILVRNNAWDAAGELIQFLHDNQINDNETVEWCEAVLQKEKDNDSTGALERCRTLEPRLAASEDPEEWYSEFYYLMATLTAEEMDARKDYDRKPLYELLDKGLEADPEDADCLDYKAWLLMKDDRNQEALEIYHRLEEKQRRGLYVEGRLAELYYRDLDRCADKALEYYEMLLAEEENGERHFYAGMCHYRMKQLDDAVQHFLREQELDPDDIDGYFRLSYVYLMQNRLEEALEQAEKTVELARERENDTVKFFVPKVQTLRRLGRGSEAAETVLEAMRCNPSRTDLWEDLYDIYSQFGMNAELDELLKGLAKNRKNTGEAAGARILAQIRRKEFLKAKLEEFNWNTSIPKDRHNQLLRVLEAYSNHPKQEMYRLREKLKQYEKDGKQPSENELYHYALSLWRCGKEDLSRTIAEQGIARMDEKLRLFLTSHPIYLGEKAVCLALLGREAEARETLEQVRKIPPCGNCDYCTCKDADVYQVLIEEICGNLEKAMELTLEGENRWPDEEDFITEECYLKAKGIKNAGRN